MFEQWHPLGPVGIITAFNFPVAVWAWNAAVAAVCGDTMVWKPSPETPADGHRRAADRRPGRRGQRLPRGLQPLRRRAPEVGEAMVGRPPVPADLGDRELPDGPARSAQAVAARLGRSLLELGGNNAVIVTPTADLDLALRAVALRRRRHRRPALHDAPPADRPRVDRRRLPRPARRGPIASVRIGDPLGGGRPDGPADQRGGPSRR